MKANFFPNRIIEIAGLFLLSVLFATPYIFFIDNQLVSILSSVFFHALVCLIFIGISIFVNKRRKQKIEWDFKVIDFRYLYWMAIIILIFQIGINMQVYSLFDYFSGKNAEIPNQSLDFNFIFGAVLIGPILEELIFRGLILKGLLARYSPKVAIVVSALIFGLIHGQPIQMWGAFLIALFLGWIYFKTKSMGTVILLHSFSNLSVLSYDFFLPQLFDQYFIGSLIVIALSVPLLFIVIRKLYFKMTNISAVSLVQRMEN